MSDERDTAPLEVHLARTRRWVTEEPISRAVLEAVWSAEHSTPYVPDIRTYRAVVRLVVRHLWDEGDVPRPVWDDGSEPAGVTPVGARLVDALMFHIGHMSAEGDLRWGVESDPRVLSYGEPYVVPHPHLTVGGVPGAVGRVITGRSGLSVLEKPLRRAGGEHASGTGAPLEDRELASDGGSWWSRLGRSSPRRPQPRRWDLILPDSAAEPPDLVTTAREPMTVEQLVRLQGESDLPDYTYLITLDELAESEWGTEWFAGFESRLAREPGVTAVLHEDREPVHIRAPGMTAEQVLAAARRAATR